MVFVVWRLPLSILSRLGVVEALRALSVEHGAWGGTLEGGLVLWMFGSGRHRRWEKGPSFLPAALPEWLLELCQCSAELKPGGAVSRPNRSTLENCSRSTDHCGQKRSTFKSTMTLLFIIASSEHQSIRNKISSLHAYILASIHSHPSTAFPSYQPPPSLDYIHEDLVDHISCTNRRLPDAAGEQQQFSMFHDSRHVMIGPENEEGSIFADGQAP
jgi:hypothetical protein